jgi:hypothetical protein
MLTTFAWAARFAGDAALLEVEQLYKEPLRPARATVT